MIKRKRTPKIFFGWWINIVTAILSGLAWGFYGLGISALFKPIASELGLSRAAASVAASVGRLEGGIQAPVTGILSDKFGPKWLILTGTCLMGVGLASMYFVNSAWAYYVVWGLMIATGHNIAFTIAIDKILTNWFVRKRGLTFGTRFAIHGVVGALVVPIVTWLITLYGWRTACLIWSAVIFAAIPLVLYFVKQNRPEYYGLLPDGADTEPGPEANIDAMIDKGVEYAAGFQETEFTLRQAMRTSAYWMLIVVWCSFGILYGAIIVHCIPFLTDMGIEPDVAGAMMALMLFFNTPSRFIGGWLTDRLRKERLKYLMTGAFLFQAMGIITFLLNQTIASVYIFLILFGLGSGAVPTVRIAISGRYFGRKAYGSIQGTSQLLAAPISLVAPIYAGWVYDVSGSYIDAFITFAVIAVFGGLFMCFVRAPRPPAEVTDIRKFM